MSGRVTDAISRILGSVHRICCVFAHAANGVATSGKRQRADGGNSDYGKVSHLSVSRSEADTC